jgi:hypothetical protein
MPLIIHGYPAATAAELIAYLQTLPPETPICHEYQSDYAPLRIEQIRRHTADERKVFVHNEGLIDWQPHYEITADRWKRYPAPKFVSVVILPGN